MPIQIIGSSGVIPDVDGTKFRALRATGRPVDYETLGSYEVTGVQASMGAGFAASGVVFSARWPRASAYAVIHSLQAIIYPTTAFTAATLTDHTSLDAYIGRSFTVSYATGGTNVTPTANSAKRRTANMKSLFDDFTGSNIMITTGNTTGLTGGTVTLDAFPFAQSLRRGNRVNPATGTEETIASTNNILNWTANVSNGECPIVLAQNEGILIRNRTVWPAAGICTVIVKMHWSEVLAY